MNIAAILISYVGTVVWGETPATQREIEVEGQHRSDAVFLTNVTVGNMDVQLWFGSQRVESPAGVPFEAGDDWLEKTTLYLFNHTNKTIVFGQILIRFPQTGSGAASSPMRVYPVTFGRLPESAAYSATTGKPLYQQTSAQPVSIPPGQSFPIRLADYTQGIRGSVDSMPYSAITKVVIQRSVFVFDDGMRWDRGSYATHSTRKGPVSGFRWLPIFSRVIRV